MNQDTGELLRRMPELRPPADSWARIERAHRRARHDGMRRLAVGMAIAASVAAAAVVMIGRLPAPEVSVKRPANPPMAIAAVPVSYTPDVPRLREQSRQLEQLLRRVPRSSRIMQADTLGAIGELEDRIAVVDERLNLTGAAPESAAEASGLWRERVDLMGRLVNARYRAAGYETASF